MNDHHSATVQVDHHYFWVLDPRDDGGVSREALSLQPGPGFALAAAVEDNAMVFAGTYMGAVRVAAQALHDAPPMDGSFEETAEYAYRSTTGNVLILNADWSEVEGLGSSLAVAGPGAYRLRVSANGRQAAVAEHGAGVHETPIEDFLIQMWPETDPSASSRSISEH